MSRVPGTTAAKALVLSVLLLLLAVLGARAGAAAAADRGEQPPWRLAQEIRQDLFDARSELLLSGSEAAAAVGDARAALRGSLRAGLEQDSPRSLKELEQGLAGAEAAVAGDDPVALGAAYGTAIGALRHGAFDLSLIHI